MIVKTLILQWYANKILNQPKTVNIDKSDQIKKIEEKIIDDHLNAKCEEHFKEVYKDAATSNKEVHYVGHDDNYCYGTIIETEKIDDVSEPVPKLATQVKCPFNKAYIEGSNKDEYSIKECQNVDANGETPTENDKQDANGETPTENDKQDSNGNQSNTKDIPNNEDMVKQIAIAVSNVMNTKPNNIGEQPNLVDSPVVKNEDMVKQIAIAVSKVMNTTPKKIEKPDDYQVVKNDMINSVAVAVAIAAAN